MSTSPQHQDAVRVLTAWRAPDAGQDDLRRQYLAHLAAHPDATSRSGPPAHLTASCFVLDPTLTSVLLTLHRKGGFWVQLGGHLEPADRTLADAGLREAVEEGGIADLAPHPRLGRWPADLDRHLLPDAFGRCSEHLDVAFCALADGTPEVGEESLDVAWWPVDALPADTVPDLLPRLRRLVERLRAP